MLRQHETRDPLRRCALAGRAAIFALTTVGAFALIGSAQAQECVGGYKMVKGEIPVACGDSALTAPLPSEPLYTGSIGGAAGGNGDEIPTTEFVRAYEWSKVLRRLCLPTNRK